MTSQLDVEPGFRHPLNTELNPLESLILCMALGAYGLQLYAGGVEENHLRAYHSLWNKTNPPSSPGFSQWETDNLVAALDGQGKLFHDGY